MLFNKCESCNNVGTCACRCESPTRFFCDSHVSNHITSGGKHSTEPALEGLTSSEISSIEDAYNNYWLSSLCHAIQIRNSRIEKSLRKIRTVEEGCSSYIKAILSGSITRDIRQVLFYRALPLFSDSSIIRSLLDLKQAPDFSCPKIMDLLNSFNSSLLSSFPSLFSSRTSCAASVQTSYTSSLSIQSLPSQIDIVRTADSANYAWELLQQAQPHNEGINSIAVSECERYIASASREHTIKILELKTLRPLRTLTGHTNWVTSVSFLGKKVVSGSLDSSIKIWKEDRCEKTLNLHSLWVTSVCVSSCKRLIVSGSSDKTAVVFRLENNKALHTLKHLDSVLSVAFSQNNKEIISGSGDFDLLKEFRETGEIRIWKTETGQLLKTLKAHSRPVTCVNFSGKFIVSSSIDKTVKIWDMGNNLNSWCWNKNKPLLAFSDHTEGVVSVDISDNIVASLGEDDRIIVRDIRTGTISQILQAHGTYDTNFGWSPMCLKVLEGGKFIVSGGTDKIVRVWRRVN